MNVLIIGCGSIGALKPSHIDYKGGKPLTHANALWNLKNSGEVKEVYVIDNDREKEQAAINKWGFKKFFMEAGHQNKIDVVVVATPTETHRTACKFALTTFNNLKILICEKPFCPNGKDAQFVSNLASKNNVKIVVNYLRRYVPAFYDLKLNKVHHCRLTYGRGLKREASHAIDLFNMWFGKMQIPSVFPSKGVPDYSEQDLTYSAHLHYEKCHDVFLCPVDARDYGIYQIDIFTNEGLISFTENGRRKRTRGIVKEEVYGDYSVLDEKEKVTETLLEESLMNMWYDTINGVYRSTDKNAKEVHNVIKELV